MADNIYLLETRLSPSQQAALEAIRQVARGQGVTVFLVGGAVRDLMSGSPVRDLDVVVQGNALTLRADVEKLGGVYSGESKLLQALYVRFPGGVRVEVGSTLSVTYPKPGKPVYEAATILDDLRRRDFTANAMALSLNDGSYGLLMDPLNGVADIENRELRLVSNYGFIEDPVRLIRAARFMARLGWQMDERTKARYDTAKEEGYISALQAGNRGYEVEELFHEEEPLRVLRRLEEEGWLAHLAPALSVGKANAAELAKVREVQMQLETRGVRADAAAANFPLLTAKLADKEVAELKKSFPRALFVEEIDSLESSAKELSSQLLSKSMALPSEAYKLILRSAPASVLWAVYSSKSAALQTRFKSFSTEWPLAQGKIPFVLLGEMRITPDLPGYAELLETLFYALMDGRLGTPEEMRAFLEPYSPPAPPPPVSLRRARATKKEAKSPKSRKKAVAEPEAEAASAPIEAVAEQATSPEATPVTRASDKKPGAKDKEATASPVQGAPTEPVKSAVSKQAAKEPVKAPAKAAAAPARVTKSAPVKKKESAKQGAPAAKVSAKSPAKAAQRTPPAPKKAPAKKAPERKAGKLPAKKTGGAKVAAKKVANKPAPKKASSAKVPAKKVPAKKAPAKKPLKKTSRSR